MAAIDNRETNSKWNQPNWLPDPFFKESIKEISKRPATTSGKLQTTASPSPIRPQNHYTDRRRPSTSLNRQRQRYRTNRMQAHNANNNISFVSPKLRINISNNMAKKPLKKYLKANKGQKKMRCHNTNKTSKKINIFNNKVYNMERQGKQLRNYVVDKYDSSMPLSLVVKTLV